MSAKFPRGGSRTFFSSKSIPLYTPFYPGKKHEKDFQNILNTLRCDMVTTMTSRIDVRLFAFFYLSYGLVGLCEIEICQMGKGNGNPDLVCENAFSYTIQFNDYISTLSVVEEYFLFKYQ